MRSRSASRTVDILRELVLRELRARYKQSLLGPVWIVLAPLLLLAPLTVFFRFFVPSDTNVPYTLFVYAGLLPWLFFSESVRTATESLVVNAPLIRRVSFARSLLPLAMVGTRAVEFALVGIVTLPPALFFADVLPNASILFLPLVFLFLILFASGIGLATSVLFAFYRDVRHVVHILLTFWMYATPIVYAPEMVSASAQRLLAFNPLTAFAEATRDSLFGGTPPSLTQLLVLASWAGASLLLGGGIFRARRKEIADVV